MQVRQHATNHALRSERQRLDVWLLSTQLHPAERAIYEDVLSSSERQAAQRFRFEADRERSIASRGGLRWILSGYCGVPPNELNFQVSKHGKPSLAGPIALEFNVSHSGDYVLIGVTEGSPCGVDIERSNSRVREKDIAARFFCPREVEWLDRTDKGFLRLWTMKEAIIKAVGRGLSIPLCDVDVTDIAEGKASSMTLDTQELWVKELEVVEGYAAAVSMVGGEAEVSLK
jgi:4'-phosphopantetheinyl transferase